MSELRLPWLQVDRLVNTWDAPLAEVLPRCLSYFSNRHWNPLGRLSSLGIRAVIHVCPEPGSWIGLCLLRLHGADGRTLDVQWPAVVEHFDGQTDEVPADACAVFIDEEPEWNMPVSRRFMALVEASRPSSVRRDDLSGIVTLIPGGEHPHSSHFLPEGWTLEYTDDGLPQHSLPYEYDLMHEEGSDILLASQEGGPSVECAIHRVPLLEPSSHALAWLVARGLNDSQRLFTLQSQSEQGSWLAVKDTHRA